jgi:signal transduction histidine kinase
VADVTPEDGVLRVCTAADGSITDVARGAGSLDLSLVPGDELFAALDVFSKDLGDVVRRCLRSDSPVSGTWLRPTRDGDGELLRFFCRPRDDAGWVVDLKVLGESDRRGPAAAYVAEVQSILTAAERMVNETGGDRAYRESITALLEVLCSALAMEAGCLLAVREGVRGEVVAAYGRTRQRGYPYAAVDLSDSSLSSLLPGPATVVEVGLDPGVHGLLRPVLRPGARQVVVLPVTREPGTGAVLILSRRHRAPLDADQLWLLHIFQGLCGLMTQNDALSLATERRSTVLETAYAVARAISRHLDVQETFRVIAVNAARLLRGSRALLLQLDEATHDLVAVASSEQDDAGVIGTKVRFRGMRPETALLDRHVMLAIDDVVWDASVDAGTGRQFEAKVVLLLPMYAGNELIGALAFFGGGRRSGFSASDIELAEEMVEQAAVAIQNARLYGDLAHSRARIESLLAGMARVRELERQRLARIVHDDLIQSVVGALYQLQTAHRTLPEGSGSKLEKPIDVLRAAVGEARSVISDLRPPVLGEVGLVGSLETLVADVKRQTDAAVSTILEDTPGISDGAAVALYRIAREALTNAVRHAHADLIYLTLKARSSAHGRQAWMMIWDDGVGCDQEACQSSEHYGWSMMEEQAALVGGVTKIVSILGAGTTVETVGPVRNGLHGGDIDVD